MNTILWILQVLLAVSFLYSGLCKSIKSEQWLVTHGQTGVVGLQVWLIKFIGTCEILGTVGLILPWLLNIQPLLTPISAICFCLVMLLAIPKHYKLKEPKNVAVNVIIFLMSALVAFGRTFVE